MQVVQRIIKSRTRIVFILVYKIKFRVKMAEKFIEDLVAEQQRIADTIVNLKGEIKQVHDSVGDKEIKIQELAGKLDVLKQVHDFYTKGAIQQEQPQEQPQQQEQPPQEQQPQQQQQQQPQQQEPEPQSVFNPDQKEGQN